tara:strand:- start:384 stop:788 length:405 start_codon:yes stop_codon:yes gene_type:complete
MRYFLICGLLIMASCSSNRYSYSYFVDCEKTFSKFTNLSSCALKKIQKDCNNNTNCRNENTRFVDAIKRLQIMLEKNEITDNEAMFRYYNLIDFEESKFKIRGKKEFSNYHYYPHSFYFQGMASCYFSRTGFCY